ncbi:MAG: flagellar hook-basal body complex protein, partial [Campylobacterota bacterium]|nr:flagellar hook-basal body complex protein [Campylobacterota bacterium]
YIASDASLVPGSSVTVTQAVEGLGFGAVQSVKEALVTVGSGYQRDVWSSSELPTLGTDTDSDGGSLGDTILFTIANPSDTNNPFTVELTEGTSAVTLVGSTSTATLSGALSDTNKIDSLVEAINGHSEMAKYVKAHNYNGNLVVETINTDPGGTFVSSMSWAEDGTAADYATQNKSTILSINSGTDAEFLEMTNTLDQTASRDSLQLRLDNLGISDSAFGDFSIDATGLITMTQDGATFAVGQTAIAMFNNERGLIAEGNNLMSKTNDSGNAIFNINNDKAAKVAGKTLELSTADLSESLVNLMVFQRAFEANSKSITTSDQILTTLIQLKK